MCEMSTIVNLYRVVPSGLEGIESEQGIHQSQSVISEDVVAKLPCEQREASYSQNDHRYGGLVRSLQLCGHT